MFLRATVKLSLVVVLVALLTNSAVQFILYLDLNKRVYNHVPGACSNVGGIENGAADMEFVQSLGLVFTTSGLRFYNSTDLANIRGTVYTYNISSLTSWELKLTSNSLNEKTFNPDGISSWQDDGKTLIFIVNHRKRTDTIEVFRFKDSPKEKSLTHLRTVKSPIFKNLRDIVAVSKDRFYVTNMHYFERPFLKTLELYLGLKLGSIGYFDGKNASFVHRWLATPNGISMDKSKRYVYVASMAAEAIKVFQIEADANLTYHSEISLLTTPDKITVDPYTADLYVGCHPIKGRYFRHEYQPKNISSPSQVLRIHGRPGKGWRITQAYANDGATLSASSVAIRHKGTLLIGGVHDKMLSCDLEAPPLL